MPLPTYKIALDKVLYFSIGGDAVSANNSSASEIIACCNAILFGSPSGYPNPKETNKARGGLTLFVILPSSVIETVVIPAVSTAR